MKNYKWINLFLVLLIVVVAAFQVTHASANHQLFSGMVPSVKIRPHQISKGEAEGLYKKAIILAEKYAKGFKSQPGDWYHWQTVVSDNSAIQMTYPDGSTIPATTIHESWYTLNKQGMIENGLYLVKNQDGQILQQVVYQQNIAYNLTFPDIVPIKMEADTFGSQAYFDFNFLKDMRKSIDTDAFTNLEAKSIDMDGKPALQFALQWEYETPVAIAEFSALVQSVTTRLVFDIETGESNQIETIYHLTDGTETTSLMTVTLLEKLPSLPAEIQQLVDQHVQK